MKKKLIVAVLLALASLFFYQCRKEDTHENGGKTPEHEESTEQEQPELTEAEFIACAEDYYCENIDTLLTDRVFRRTECTEQVLDESKRKSMQRFADSVWNVLFDGGSLSKDAKVITTDLVEKVDKYDKSKYTVYHPCLASMPSWGPTAYNPDVFSVVRITENKVLEVYIYPQKGYFRYGGKLYLKLCSVNSGDYFGGVFAPYKAGDTFVALEVSLDDLVTGRSDEKEGGAGFILATQKLFPFEHGVTTISPLLISENGYRSYPHPIDIETVELFNYKDLSPAMNTSKGYSNGYGEVYGTYCGVRIICDGAGNKNHDLWKYDQKFQCVELCRRFLKLMYGITNVPTGDATEWRDVSKYPKLEAFKSGSYEAPRQGDVVVWSRLNHVGVISRVDFEKGKVFIAQQNAEGGSPLLLEKSLDFNNGYQIPGIHSWIRPVFEINDMPDSPQDPEPDPEPEPESQIPSISASLSASNVEVGGSVLLIVDTDIECNISYRIGTTSYRYETRSYLPTDTEGYYTVTITATATDGGKTATATRSYTVTKKEEPKPTEVNLTLGNLPSKVYKGDNATLYFSTGGVPCKIEYQYGTLSKETYSDNATQGYVPLFTTNGASDVKLTIYATPLDNLQKTYEKSVVYDVEYRFTVNFNEPSGSSFAVGAVKYFEVHSPYHSVDASFEYYQKSDLNEYEDDFNQHSHELYTGKSGHYKINIKVVNRDNPDEYKTYTYEYDVEQEEEEQNPPEISFDEDSGLHIDVGEDFTLTITTDQTCKIKAYDDNDDLIDSESDTKRLVIDVPTDFEVGTYYIKVKATASDGSETEEKWKYRLDPVRLKDAKTDKTISFCGRQYALEPNPDGFVVDYRGNGIFRVYKSDGRNFGTGGDFYIYPYGDFESLEDGMDCSPDICWPIAHVEKDGDEFYDLRVSESHKGVKLYLFEIHEGDAGYYIGPFTF
jgi:hypothetical protein